MDFLKLLKPTAQVSRNAFDLSRKHVFSSKAGQARPVLAIETVPNDFFEIDLAGLMRSQTLATAAFLRGKQRYDFFFVPNVQTWHPFNQFISQRKDVHSSRQLGSTYAPVVNLLSLLQMITLGFNTTVNYKKDVFGYDVRPVIFENLQLLGYGDYRYLASMSPADLTEFFEINASSLSNKYVNLFRLAAYQHIWYDFYRNKYYDIDGNDSTGGIEGRDYEGSDSNVPSVSMFNFDDIDCSTFANSVVTCDYTSADSRARWSKILKPRYIQWKKDLFTSALPGQQFGAVSSVNIGGSFDWTHSHAVDDDTSDTISFSSDSVEIGDGATTEVSLSGSNISFSSGGLSGSMDLSHKHNLDTNTSSAGSVVSNLGSFDVLSLRKAEMLQAWKQATLRAGNMTDDQFKAHYGVEPYYDSDENVRFLGSFSQRFDINPVEATAATSSDGNDYNFNVGDIAATGRAVVSGNKIKFECKDFGVIMCIASFLPEAEYEACGIDKANTLHEQFDYFTPEFQNIGLEAVNALNFFPVGTSDRTMGYAPRYWMYKEARDKVFGEFSTAWFGSDVATADYKKTPSLGMWVTPRHPAYLLGGTSRQISNFYVDPKVLNSIFYTAANENPNTDQFIHNVYFDIKSVRPMSVLGLPQF